MRFTVVCLLLTLAACGGETGGNGAGGTAGQGGTGGAAGSGGASLRCPVLPGPTMAQIGARCVDTTEVTQQQYDDFRTVPTEERPSPDGCDWNQTVEPTCPHDPNTPNLPANCVDFCDAATYCAWAGKRLCGDDEWLGACSNSGQAPFQYGNKYSEDACYHGTLAKPQVAVSSYPGCHGVKPPYDQIFDMNGNAEEWVRTPDTQAPDSCMTRDTLFGALSTSDLNCSRSGLGSCTNAHAYLGFRCCADAR